MRHERITDRIGLGSGGSLSLFLRNRALFDADQWLSGDPVKDIHPARLARLCKSFSQNTLILQVEQDNRIRRIEIPDVVVNLLEVPAVLTRIGVKSNNRGCEQIVTGPDCAVVVRPRITGRKINQTQLRVHRWRVPDCTTAGFPGITVGRPGIRTEFARCRHGIKRPEQRAIRGIIGLHPAARSELSASESADDHAVKVQRRTGDGVALLPAFRLNRPHLLSGFGIECLQHPIELAHKYFIFAITHAPTRPATANG